jgi:predicted TIM-barrel fold metal-dependent hydrolase
VALNLIAIEEHFWTPELRELRTAQINRSGDHLVRLDDLGALRLREMDEAGIDMQVLSETAPAAQVFEPEQSIRLARNSNDYLHEAIRVHPDRFAGFAALPTPDPKAAADELERAVTKLGFKGAMIMGLSRGNRFLDEKPFWPIFERAQALDVPIYLHPSTPHPAVTEVYYKGFAGLAGPTLGFGNYPKLKVILGHLGEGLPFLQWRIDRSMERDAKLPRSFTDYMRQHFWITTSGAFSNSALACSIAEMGIEKVIFSVDWPYVSNVKGREFLDAAPISDQERRLIASENVRRLLKL